MIIGKIIGGLGNQMFQYVFYKYLSYTKKIELKLDLEDFNSYYLHNGFELKKIFRINEGVANNYEINSYKSDFPLLFKIENKFLNKNILFGEKHFKENNFSINNKIFKDNISDFYVEGYFQTPKFINYLLNENISFFDFKTNLIDKEKKILNGNTVSIHIRGGDYIQNPKDMKLFGNICTKAYYQMAIKHIKSKVNKVKFIVFTNDLEYAKTILSDEKYTFITWNSKENNFRDMYLMTQCKHNIIANSSFSWWGAFLNKNEKKIVISPSIWFNSSQIDQDNILSVEWIKISKDGVLV